MKAESREVSSPFWPNKNNTHNLGHFPTFSELLHSKGMRHVIHGDGIDLNYTVVLAVNNKRAKREEKKGAEGHVKYLYNYCTLALKSMFNLK